MEVIYYFHPCAQVCAKWIPDKLLRQQMVLAEGIIVGACNMYAMAPLPLATATPQINHPQTAWLLKSIEHFEWIAVYFQTIILEYNKINGTKFSPHLVMRAASDIGKCFPRSRWSDPDIEFPPDCLRDTVMDSYRALFLSTKVRANSYKRVKPPYWVSERRIYALDLG